jgi:hypothetical protein
MCLKYLNGGNLAAAGNHLQLKTQDLGENPRIQINKPPNTTKATS